MNFHDSSDVTQAHHARYTTSDDITEVDIKIRRTSKAMKEQPKRITRAQAFYAVLWQGFDAREVRRYL